jgi:hypothetical protein
MINNAVAVKPKILTSIKKFFQFFYNCLKKRMHIKQKAVKFKNNIFLYVFFYFHEK